MYVVMHQMFQLIHLIVFFLKCTYIFAMFIYLMDVVCDKTSDFYLCPLINSPGAYLTGLWLKRLPVHAR